jgi:hypothetical protein
MPPEVKPIDARLIRIEDIDGGVKKWFKRVLDLQLKGPQGDRQPVTVKFMSGERWVAAADREGVRDKDGRLILPLVQIGRISIDPQHNRTGLGANVPRLTVAKLVSEQSSQLANLDQSRPISARRFLDTAVYDIYTVPFPSNNNLVYKVRIQAQFQTHINEVLEKILYHLEFYNVPSFVISLADDERQRGIQRGQGSTELIPEDHAIYDERDPLTDYYVVGYIDGEISDEGNSDDFTDQERILQQTFTFTVPTVLMLDPVGDTPAVTHQTSAFGITLGVEVAHRLDSRVDLDRIFNGNPDLDLIFGRKRLKSPLK